MIFAPFRVHASEMARPMLEEEPVVIATLPASWLEDSGEEDILKVDKVGRTMQYGGKSTLGLERKG